MLLRITRCIYAVTYIDVHGDAIDVHGDAVGHIMNDAVGHIMSDLDMHDVHE